MMIDCPSGHVTVRYKNKDGKEKVEDEHMDLPADLANGLIPILLKNVQRGRVAVQRVVRRRDAQTPAGEGEP